MQDTQYFMGFTPVFFYGVVEDINDPLKTGRVRVRCLGFHTPDNNKIKTKDLAWATVALPTTSPAMQGLGQNPFIVQGTWCIGLWRDAQLMQEPVILAVLPGIPQKAAALTDIGFADPDHKYPSERIEASGHGVQETDINRLARNDEPHTALTQKNESRESEVPIGKGDSTWSEPENIQNSQYPFNHVFESESGHRKEYDDSPQFERIAEFHKSGSGYEIDANGNKIIRVVGDTYEIVIANKNVLVKGDCNLTIMGNANLRIEGNANEYIEGDKVIEIKGNLTQTIGGNINTTATGDITFTGKTLSFISGVGQFTLSASQARIVANLEIRGTAVIHNGKNIGSLHVHTGNMGAPTSPPV